MPGLYGQASMGTLLEDGRRSGRFFNPQYTQYPGVLDITNASYVIAPAVLNTANIAAAQTPAAAGYLTLTAGAGVTLVTYQGAPAYQLDVARAVSLTGTANGNACNWTVYGYDIYGNAVGETRAFAGGAVTLASTKTYAYITKMYVDAGTATNVTAGTADKFGVPFVANTFDTIVTLYWNQVALAAGAFTVADATNPATAVTGDVRGVVTVPNASDGTKRLVAYQNIVGATPPTATQTLVGYVGVPQFIPALI